MRRGLAWAGLVVLLVGVTGCRAVRSGPEAGSESSEQAVSQFLAGARAGDLQAVSAVWGNAVSPTRDRTDRRELEQRLLIIVCHLKHDEASVGAAQAAPEGRTMHRVELTQGTRTAAVNFTTIRNTRSQRWFVEAFDLAAVRDFCRAGSARPGSRT